MTAHPLVVPVVSVSLGDTARILFGGARRLQIHFGLADEVSVFAQNRLAFGVKMMDV